MNNKKRIQVIFILFIMLSAFVGCTPDQYEPKEGIWFCEELQIQLSYEQHTQSFTIINGEKIKCACGSDRGVPYLHVSCQETDHPMYRLGQEIFSAKIISLSETEFVVYDEESLQRYVFIRQE